MNLFKYNKGDILIQKILSVQINPIFFEIDIGSSPTSETLRPSSLRIQIDPISETQAIEALSRPRSREALRLKNLGRVFDSINYRFMKVWEYSSASLFSFFPGNFGTIAPSIGLIPDIFQAAFGIVEIKRSEYVEPDKKDRLIKLGYLGLSRGLTNLCADINFILSKTTGSSGLTQFGIVGFSFAIVAEGLSLYKGILFDLPNNRALILKHGQIREQLSPEPAHEVIITSELEAVKDGIRKMSKKVIRNQKIEKLSNELMAAGRVGLCVFAIASIAHLTQFGTFLSITNPLSAISFIGLALYIFGAAKRLNLDRNRYQRQVEMNRITYSETVAPLSSSHHRIYNPIDGIRRDPNLLAEKLFHELHHENGQGPFTTLIESIGLDAQQLRQDPRLLYFKETFLQHINFTLRTEALDLDEESS